jgi:hypothetical protein
LRWRVHVETQDPPILEEEESSEQNPPRCGVAPSAKGGCGASCHHLEASACIALSLPLLPNTSNLRTSTSSPPPPSPPWPTRERRRAR